MMANVENMDDEQLANWTGLQFAQAARGVREAATRIGGLSQTAQDDFAAAQAEIQSGIDAMRAWRNTYVPAANQGGTCRMSSS